MSDRIEVVVTGKDGVSKVFREVSNGAQQMGNTVDAAAKKGAAGLREQLRASDDLKLGAAALVTTFALASRAATEETRSVDGLKRAYGDASSEIINFTNDLQDAGIAQNDVAREAASIASTLAQRYDFEASQIETLIARSADLAQVKGVDLADATERVSAAMRGEGESAELLGLTLSDSAVAAEAAARGMEGWNTTMSESEKAAFRFQLFLEQSSYAQGAAAKAADSTAGSVRQLGWEVQDTAVRFVQWTGPIGQATAALSENALEIGLAVGGTAKLGSGLADLVGKQRLAETGTKLLNAAMGPTGLVIGVVAAGVAIAGLVEDLKGYEYQSTAAAHASDDLANFFASIARFLPTELAPAVQDVINQLDTLQSQGLANTGLRAELEVIKAGYSSVDQIIGVTSDEFARLTERQKEWLDTNKDGGISLEELQAGFDEVSGRIRLTGEQVQAVDEAVKSLLSNQNVDPAKLIPDIFAAMEEFDRTGDAEAFVKTIQAMAAGWHVYADSTHAAARGTNALGSELVSIGGRLTVAAGLVGKTADALDGYSNTLKENVLIATQDVGDALLEAGGLFGDVAASVDDYAQTLRENGIAATVAVGDALTKAGTLFGQTAETVDGYSQAMDNNAAAIYEAAQALQVLNTYAQQIRPIDLAVVGADRATGHAAIVQDLAEGLDSVLGTYQTIDQLNQRAAQAGSIAENLIGKPGELAVIDDLLKRGVISQTRYNMAVESGYRIQQRQASVEEDLNVIRTKQLPLLDEADKAYAREIDRISHLSAEQQTVALGFLDAAKARELQEATALAAAAAETEAGSSARQAAEETIKAKAIADPVFRAMAESIGLITTDKEGNITVNFDNADTLKDAVDRLTESLDELTRVLGGIPPSVTTHVSVTGVGAALEAIGQVAGAIDRVNNTPVGEPNLPATSNGGDGSVGEVAGNWRGGVAFDAYARGGAVRARLAEYGPELLRFAGGGVAMAPYDGLYDVPRNTYVETAPNTRTILSGKGAMEFHAHFHGDIHGFSGLEDVVDTLEGMVSARLSGLGMP